MVKERTGCEVTRVIAGGLLTVLRRRLHGMTCEQPASI